MCITLLSVFIGNDPVIASFIVFQSKQSILHPHQREPAILNLMALQDILNTNPPLERFWLPNGCIRIQRDDLIHPIISGNKWRKLQGWIGRAINEGKTTVLTFGGAYSNHLLATACAAKFAGLKSIGILRGEEKMSNGYTKICLQHTMQLLGISRASYRNKAEALSMVKALPVFKNTHWDKVLVIDEGGKGEDGLLGFIDLIEDWKNKGVSPTAIYHASATGTTAVGLVKAVHQYGMQSTVEAVLVLKNINEQRAMAKEFSVESKINWIEGYEFGGYAKTTPILLGFMETVEKMNRIRLDPVYTAKALFALNEGLLSSDNQGKDIVFLHTGGVLNPNN